MNTVWDNLNMWIYGVASALFAGVIILIRKILTNEKQLLLMEQKFKMIEEDLKEVKADVKSLVTRNVRVDE